MGPNSSDLPKGALSDSNDTIQFLRWRRTAKIFGNPSEKQTEDYVTGRFG